MCLRQRNTLDPYVPCDLYVVLCSWNINSDKFNSTRNLEAILCPGAAWKRGNTIPLYYQLLKTAVCAFTPHTPPKHHPPPRRKTRYSLTSHAKQHWRPSPADRHTAPKENKNQKKTPSPAVDVPGIMTKKKEKETNKMSTICQEKKEERKKEVCKQETEVTNHQSKKSSPEVLFRPAQHTRY